MKTNEELREDAERRLYALHTEMLWTRLAAFILVLLGIVLAGAFLL